MLYIILLVLAAFSSCHPLHDQRDSSPTVTIDSGVIVGVQTTVATLPNIVNKFLGIPFAASPTRFAPPETPTPWTQPRQVNQNGPACIQQFVYPEPRRSVIMAAFNNPAPPESEDCLTVNVFTPANASGPPKAVLFWIYGGSLQYGSNSQVIYDGTSFVANQDVVLVVTNYRTNVFGFPSTSTLPIESRNLGFLDQHLALSWVQRNIAAFNGDPSRVTIFGESAGSVSVDALLTSLPTNPPFYAAIMESGQNTGRSGGPAVQNSGWDNLSAALNCSSSDLACLRAAPATTIKDIIERGALSFRPVADNITSISNPLRARRLGQVAQVPILTGSNSDEGILFTYPANDTEAYLTASFGAGLTSEMLQGILRAYPIGQRGIFEESAQISQIYGEVSFQCPSKFVAEDTAAVGIPSWRYWYNATFPSIQPLPGIDFSRYGAYHASEIPIIWGTYGAYGQIPDSGKRLSELLQNIWATFAKNPHGGPAPGWDGAGTGFVQVLGGKDGVGQQGHLRRAGNTVEIDGGRCEIWQPLYPV